MGMLQRDPERSAATPITAGSTAITRFSFADYYDPEHVGYSVAAGDQRGPGGSRAPASAPTATATWRS
ncbi:MAG: hypothetical protein MZV65_29330 [Chromatiales bacterium]|nr:hypothetical protein [Chromatiales bacterium]